MRKLQRWWHGVSRCIVDMKIFQSCVWIVRDICHFSVLIKNDGLDACSMLIKHHFILVICKYHTFSLEGSFSQCCATLLYNDVKIKTVLRSFYLVAVLTTPALTRPGGAVWARPGAVTDCSPQTWTWTWQRSTLELQTINRRSCTTTENAPTRAFSWLKAPTSAFTFKTLLRHYAKLNRPSLMTFASRTQFHVERPWGQCPFSIVS